MNLDLCTIDWTAIGSIATVIAMIIAYRTIYISVKQNKDNQKFQTLLVQREIEQKRLDELVDNIMIINDSIQPIIVGYIICCHFIYKMSVVFCENPFC